MWITDVLGLLVSAFCVPRVPTDSLALFLFIAEWNISAIYEVKYFRALSVCWSVLPVYFLKGTNLHKTRGTGEWQWVLGFSSLSGAVLRDPQAQNSRLGKLNSSCFAPRPTYWKQLHVVCRCFSCAEVKLHWHQWSYLWNKEVSEWSQCFRGLLLKKLPAAIGKTSLSLSICQWNWKESLEGERELALWWWSQRAAISKVAAPSHLTTCREMPVSFLGGSLTLLLSFWEWTIVLTKGATSFYKVMEKEKQNSLLILQIKPHC